MNLAKGISGWLCIDKPAGMTSHDVVAFARKTLKIKKIGHTGTLDPMATGLLVLGIGEATKFIKYLPAGEKLYSGEITFGIHTDSWDITGEILEKSDIGNFPSEERIVQSLDCLSGKRMQKVPPVSAVKINGERLYRKALRGEVFELPEREINIYSIKLTAYNPSGKISLDVSCSPGTYIRTIAIEIGEALKLPATLSSLRRLRSNGFGQSDMNKTIDAENMIPVAQGLDFPQHSLEMDNAVRFANGNRIKSDNLPEVPATEIKYFSVNYNDLFLGVGRLENGILYPEKVSSEARRKTGQI